MALADDFERLAEVIAGSTSRTPEEQAYMALQQSIANVVQVMFLYFPNQLIPVLEETLEYYKGKIK